MEEVFNKVFKACKDGDITRFNDLKTSIGEEKFHKIINQTAKYGYTPIWIACDSNHIEIVKLLILANVDINKADDYGWTPIYIACDNGTLEIVKLLILANADINKATDYGDTPISIACNNGLLEIVKLLLYYDVDMSNITLSNYKTKLNLPNNELSYTSTNNDIRSYLIKEINWDHRKHFIIFLDKTSFIYNNDRSEDNKVLNKKNRDLLSLDVHNCILNNHRLIACFLG